MTTKKHQYPQILTPEFRLVQYKNSLFTPEQKANAKTGKTYEQFDIKCLFPKSTDLKALKQAVLDVIKREEGEETYKKFVEAFKKFWPEMPEKVAGIGQPFRNGDDKKWPGFAGHVYLSARTNFRPTVIDRNKQEVIDPDQAYSGVFARANLIPKSYDVEGGRGVRLMLKNVQILGGGERLFSGADAADDYNDLPAQNGQPASGADSIDDL